MGEDGHTASLFPGTEIMADHPALVAAIHRKDDPVRRLTFTPRLLNNAKHLLVLVSGQNKANVIADILEKKVKNKYPIQMLQQIKAHWLIDAEAASSLKK
jgi:6-phosphogluconolactonase